MEDASLRPASRPNLYVPRRSSRIALHAPAAIPNMRRRHHQATLGNAAHHGSRSEEHTSELQSLMRISYAVFCLKNKKTYIVPTQSTKTTNCIHTLRSNTI